MSDGLTVQIKKILDEQMMLAREAIEEASKEVAKQTVEELKQTSPKRTGKYAKSWRSKPMTLTRGTVSYVVHNTQGQLSHLLERGHALRSGGRTRAFPHIKPAEETAIKAFEKKITEIIERG